jgi:enoyl-CoA hydratase/carnithine racemase
MATRCLRQPTLETLGLGGVLEIFSRGRLPASAGELVDRVFGPAGRRGALVVSGANGIVGAGKTMQLGSRLQPFGVTIVALDFPGVPDGIGKQFPGLVAAFGKEGAHRIMENVVRLSYDGAHLPPQLGPLHPRFLLEAIPEVLDLKRSHYATFRAAFPEIEIRSVTSGFPASKLGAGIAHPAFPHEINKVWEIVEAEPSDVTRLLWALGMIPLRVGDHWSFVLDVLFCGLTLAGLRFHRATNMPLWKVDKHIRKLLGPNPFRAHDAIGAKGANYLTWSCLHHLAEHYGGLFEPTPELVERKDSGQNWYPPNHFRPLVNWPADGAEEERLKTWILGPLCQMTSLILHEKRSHLAQVNAVGELCAQFRRGILAVIRELGPDALLKTVRAYHELHPQAAAAAWHPAAFARLEGPEGQQLYVNAEHDGTVGVITLGRESYNRDVDAELNRAIDWLKAEGIQRVIVSGDFHLSTQLVGADTSEFFPALDDAEAGFQVSYSWSRTARRLHDEFSSSVGFIHGKRCLGGMLELLLHCRHLVAVEGASLGFPEVTLPVVPGMEGCHWPFRKVAAEQWPKLLKLLLEGKPVPAGQAAGWLVDFTGPLEEALAVAWKTAAGLDGGLPERKLEKGALKELVRDVAGLAASALAAVGAREAGQSQIVLDAPGPRTAGSGAASPTTPGLEAASPATEAARKAILETVRDACGKPLGEALEAQSRHSAAFMTTPECRKGTIGAARERVMSA